MKQLVTIIGILLFTTLAMAQGTETFTGIGGGTTSAYLSRSWTGVDGSTWTATNARTDQNINGAALTLNDDTNGTYIQSGTIENGVGSITISTQRKFGGGTGSVDVYINDMLVGTVPYTNQVTTTTISDINVTGNFTIKIGDASLPDRIAFDDVSWTAYASGCSITFGTPTYDCDANTTGTDGVDLTIPYTGSATGVTAAVTIPNSGVTILADLTSVDDIILIDGLSEGDMWEVTLSGGDCDGETVSGTVPATECEPAPSVYISELSYNPCTAQGSDADCEYIVISNSGAADIDISDWELQNGIIYPFPDNTVVPAGGSISIGSSSDCGAFNFDIVTSAVGLGNSGETVELNDGNQDVSTVTYDGNIADGDCNVVCYDENATASECTSSLINNCGFAFDAVTYDCSSNTTGDNNDAVTISISYIGVDASIMSVSSMSGTVGGDDPKTVEDGVITITGLSEGDAWDVTINGGDCDGTSQSGTIPSTQCDPPAAGCDGGGLLINEFSNGASGAQEYIELVVVGDPSNPLATVDLSNWIIDDNNGDFGTSGVARGYVRLGTEFSAMTPGDIIVIYNDKERNTALPPDDIDDSDGDGVYIIPANSNVIWSTGTTGDGCTPSPVAPNTSGCTEGSSEFSGTLSNNNDNAWASIGYRNGGDAAVVRCPDESVYHALVFGDNNTGGIPQAVYAGSGGSGANWTYGCNSMFNENAFTEGDAGTNQSPGAANNDDNQDFIDAINAGTVDYDNLFSTSGDFTCAQVTQPVELVGFSGVLDGDKVRLKWTTASEVNNDYFEVLRSRDGYDFSSIGRVMGHGSTTKSQDYELIDVKPYQGINLYQLVQYDYDGTAQRFPLISIFTKSEFSVYSAGKFIYIDADEKASGKMNIIDLQGRVVLSRTIDLDKGHNTLRCADITSGIYIIQIMSNTQMYNQKISLY